MNKKQYLNLMTKFAAQTDPLERERDRVLQRRNITTVTPPGPVIEQRSRFQHQGNAFTPAVTDVHLKARQEPYPTYGTPRGRRHNKARNTNMLTYINGKNPQSKYSWIVKALNWTPKTRAEAAATAVFPGWKNESSIYPEGVPITPELHKSRNISQARELAERIAKHNATAANILQTYLQARGDENYNNARHAGLQGLHKDPRTGILQRPTVNIRTGGQTTVKFPDAQYDEKGNMTKAPPGISVDQARQAEALGFQMGTNRRYSPFLSWLYR